MYHLDKDCADCFVFTYKEGLLSAVAHDLKIKVTRFQIDVDEVARTVDGRFDAASLRVVCAMRDGAESKGTLSADQKREIEGNIVRDVLEAEKYPEVRYVSTAVEEDGDGFRIKGQLSLHGKRKTVEVAVRKEREGYVAGARLHQPDFGIRPYSALLGALKVKANVEIRIVVRWPAGKDEAQ
jgi:polyisoprenoid-binding protein YceI